MKTKNVTLSIAASELRLIFSTPVAWVMLTIFTVLCGMTFADVVRLHVETLAAGRHISFLTQSIFTSDELGLFPEVKGYLYLFIPLVSMGMISRDLGSGTYKLLYSSPVSDLQMVAGKFLAMVGYGLSMMAVLAVFVCYGCYAIVSPDVPLLLCGMLGLFLLLCTYSAIGIFMSSLTSYQVVAALATFALLAVLSKMRDVGQDTPWIRDLTWWLSIDGRCETFISGLVCSEDVIYFIAVTVFFLGLTVLRISNRRRSCRTAVRILSYTGVTALLVAVSIVSSRPSLMGFCDVTETESQTITIPSREVMNSVEGPVEITTYANILDEEGFYLGIPSMTNYDRAYLKPYIRFKPDIRLKTVYYWANAGSKAAGRRFPGLPDDQKAERIADVYEMDFDRFLSPQQVASLVDLSGEGYKTVRQIRLADGRTTFLRYFDDSQRQPGEKEITAAFKRLVWGSVPVGFLTGHGERDIRRDGDADYNAFAASRSFRHSLMNNGFDAVNISLDGGRTIPDSIRILIIADPRERMSEEEVAEIRRYIDRGGNLILAAEPGRQANANDIAGIFGARFLDGRLAVPPGDSRQDLILADVAKAAFSEMPALAQMRNHGYKITMPGSVGINTDGVSGFDCAHMLLSARNTWNEFRTTDFANTVATLDSADGEKEGSRAVAAMLTRSIDGCRSQKIILLGDADCFSNAELMRDRYTVSSGNFTLIYQIFHWMSDGEYPVDTPRKNGSDWSMRVGIEQMPALKWILAVILPLLMLLTSLLIIIRRKSK